MFELAVLLQLPLFVLNVGGIEESKLLSSSNLHLYTWFCIPDNKIRNCKGRNGNVLFPLLLQDQHSRPWPNAQ